MQVFLNLFKNLLDVVNEKALDEVKTTITVVEKNNKVQIEFADNAGGIDQDVIDKVFLPYFTTKDELQGTGLGLYLSKSIVEEHCNGLLSVANKNSGACFTMVLPK